MLVLGRRFGESITLKTSDGEITVTLLQREGHDGMQFSIDAPKVVKVVRP